MISYRQITSQFLSPEDEDLFLKDLAKLLRKYSDADVLTFVAKEFPDKLEYVKKLVDEITAKPKEEPLIEEQPIASDYKSYIPKPYKIPKPHNPTLEALKKIVFDGNYELALEFAEKHGVNKFTVKNMIGTDKYLKQKRKEKLEEKLPKGKISPEETRKIIDKLMTPEKIKQEQVDIAKVMMQLDRKKDLERWQKEPLKTQEEHFKQPSNSIEAPSPIGSPSDSELLEGIENGYFDPSDEFLDKPKARPMGHDKEKDEYRKIIKNLNKKADLLRQSMNIHKKDWKSIIRSLIYEYRYDEALALAKEMGYNEKTIRQWIADDESMIKLRHNFKRNRDI